MSADSFSERRRALEESFFAQRNRQLLDELKQKMAAEAGKEQLAAATGIQDAALLALLAKERVGVESLAALSLVPLIETAWASGKVETDERDAVLKAARENGIDQQHACHQLLENWLMEKPDAELFAAWRAYVGELAKTMESATFAKLKRDIVGRARNVAEAAGGYFGFGSISPSEQKTLDAISAAFQ